MESKKQTKFRQFRNKSQIISMPREEVSSPVVDDSLTDRQNTSLKLNEPISIVESVKSEPKIEQKVHKDSVTLNLEPDIPESSSNDVPMSGNSNHNEEGGLFKLPETATVLTTPNGSQVYLIGTAHFSPKSALDVERVISHVRPSLVILELCKERSFMLTLDEATLLDQNSKLSFDEVKRAIAQKGLAQGLIYMMFIKMSASLTEKLGVAPGSEMRAGAAAAQKIPGCVVILGDRSLRVSLARAVASVSIWQKIKLIFQVLTSDFSITPEEIEKCKDKDILEQLFAELGVEYPGFKRVLLDERNVYLSHSIFHGAQYDQRIPSKVVAIVGIGHVKGIVEHWGKTNSEHVRLLNEVPETSRVRKIVNKTIKYSSIALLLFFGYRKLVPSAMKSAIQHKLSGT